MEIIHGFPTFEKPVMSEYIWHLNAHTWRYRYLISYKNAKRENRWNQLSPLITRKYRLAKKGYGGDMLKNL